MRLVRDVNAGAGLYLTSVKGGISRSLSIIVGSSVFSLSVTPLMLTELGLRDMRLNKLPMTLYCFARVMSLS